MSEVWISEPSMFNEPTTCEECEHFGDCLSGKRRRCALL